MLVGLSRIPLDFTDNFEIEADAVLRDSYSFKDVTLQAVLINS